MPVMFTGKAFVFEDIIELQEHNNNIKSAIYFWNWR